MLNFNWNKFWFEKRSRESLCIIRIFIGLTFLYKQGVFNNLLAKKVVFEFPQHTFNSPMLYYFDFFRNPIPGFEWLPHPTFTQFHMIENVVFVLTILFTLGLFTRIVGPLIALLYLYLFMLSQFIYYHHIMHFVVVLLILGFSNCSDHYSLDSLIRKAKEIPKRKILPIRLIQVLISIIYFFSFIQKLRGGWLTGDIMVVFHHQGSVYGPFIYFLNNLFSYEFLQPFEHYCWRSFAWFTLFAEGLLVFGLWVPRLRRFTLLVGVVFHFGIDLTMRVASFSFQMFCVYIAFILPEAKQHRVEYNSGNGKHKLLVSVGKLLDWFQRIKWVDSSSDNKNQKIVLYKFNETKKYDLLEILCLFPLTFIPSYTLVLLSRLFKRN